MILAWSVCRPCIFSRAFLANCSRRSIDLSCISASAMISFASSTNPATALRWPRWLSFSRLSWAIDAAVYDSASIWLLSDISVESWLFSVFWYPGWLGTKMFGAECGDKKGTGSYTELWTDELILVKFVNEVWTKVSSIVLRRDWLRFQLRHGNIMSTNGNLDEASAENKLLFVLESEQKEKYSLACCHRLTLWSGQV